MQRNASPSYSDTSAPTRQYRRATAANNGGAASGIPNHMYQGGYMPSPANHHARRGSVANMAAEMMGPQGTEALDSLRVVSSKMEDQLDKFTRPIRPWLPGLGRFLIVVTFFEDTLRILSQITEQNYYLQRHRGFPWGASHAFLYSNVTLMLVCSCLVISKRYPEYATAGLVLVVLAQGFGYGLIFEMNFFLRNLSVLGGLLMVLSDSLSVQKSLFAGIPSMDVNETDRKKYFQLFGRVLLVFLFLGFAYNGKLTIVRTIVSIVGFAACVMVAVGFKAKYSALFLVTMLSVFNFLVNNWWSLPTGHRDRDFLKYDFFQTLSIVGGLLLLVNMGPGDFSVDRKKRM